MAQVHTRVKIELTRQEKRFLDDLLSQLYDFEDDDEKIGTIIGDIYNSYAPNGDNKRSEWKGTLADIIIED